MTTPPRFPGKFQDCVCEGDRISWTDYNGLDFVATVVRDNDASLDDDDAHNVDTGVTGCDEEQQAKLLEARAAYERGEWWYGGVVLSVSYKETGIEGVIDSLYGIEVNYPGGGSSDYLTEVANHMLESNY